ncbi:Interleukin-1 receptor-like 2, partial [Varanus komodoensis]
MKEIVFLSGVKEAGCMPVQGERFLFVKEVLIIRNVREEDKGKYQCKGQYTYLGNKYNFSKSILVTVKGKKERKRTEILYPRNNTIEAELGSNVFTWCNVSSYKDTFISISWRVNKTLVDVLFKGRIEEGIQQEFSVDGAQIFIVSLNITKLKNEDYGRLFVCQAGEVAAYIRIRRPNGKIYDAYVLYPKTDTQDCFALKVLPEVLEKQCGYNLFILGRDDIPGK